MDQNKNNIIIILAGMLSQFFFFFFSNQDWLIGWQALFNGARAREVRTTLNGIEIKNVILRRIKR